MAAVSTLTRVSAKGTVRVINEATDSPSMSTVVGTQAARSLWADAAAVTVQVGGGALNTTTLVRAAASGTVNVGESTVVQTVNVGSSNTTSTTVVRSGTGGLTITATGSTLGLIATGANPITFTTNALARSRVTSDGAQNWVGVATASAPAVSAVGEARFYYDTTLNEILLSKNTSAYATLGGGGQSTISQTNGNAGAITIGQVVYHTAASGTVDLATAAADNSAARVFGVVVSASIAAAASGSVAIVGQQRSVLFEAALTLANGDEVYLSATTPGSVTNVAPATTGQVIQTLGVIDGPVTGYPGSLLVNVIFTLGPKAVV